MNRTIDVWGCPSTGFYLVERDSLLYLDRLERGRLEEASEPISHTDAMASKARWAGCSYDNCDCNRQSAPARQAEKGEGDDN